MPWFTNWATIPGDERIVPVRMILCMNIHVIRLEEAAGIYVSPRALIKSGLCGDTIVQQCLSLLD